MSVYQGDPALLLGPDGVSFKFKEGQPEMDKGLENLVWISLFTKEGWFGNALYRKESQKLGSKFEDANKLPVNLSGLNARRDAALEALQWAITEGLFQTVEVEVTNPNGQTILVNIKITPPNGEAVDLTLSNFGNTWRFQKEDPAHRRLQC